MSTKNNVTDEFRTEDVVIRGVTYKFREISAAEYDDILKIAAGPDDQADLSTVLKMMTAKSLIEPEFTMDQLLAKPYPVYNKILQTVNRLHFSVDSTEGEAPNS